MHALWLSHRRSFETVVKDIVNITYLGEYLDACHRALSGSQYVHDASLPRSPKKTRLINSRRIF